MKTNAKHIFELVAVLLAVFLVVIVFVLFLPSIASSDLAIPIKIIYELFPFILIVAFIIGVSMLKKRQISISLGFKRSHLRKQLLIALCIFALTISFVIIPLLVGVDKSNVLGIKARSLLILFYLIVKSMIFVGMGEELVWRGYFFERLKKITGVGTWAVIISSILFGLWHYPIGQNILQVIMVTGLGLIYGFARLKVKDCSTLATGIAHGLHDAVILVLGFLLL
jgi:uncharacterized protein